MFNWKKTSQPPANQLCICTFRTFSLFAPSRLLVPWRPWCSSCFFLHCPRIPGGRGALRIIAVAKECLVFVSVVHLVVPRAPSPPPPRYNLSMAKSEKKPTTKTKQPEIRLVSENRKARHRFEILDTLECGIQLMGSEVKSLRDGKLSLDEAYARVKEGEVWLVGADIAEYPQATLWNHAPKRPR